MVRALPILISISALGTANSSLFTGARYSMVASQYGYLPAVFSCIHTQRLTPIPGVILQVVTLSFKIYRLLMSFFTGFYYNYILYSKWY